ncbi:hypothetical protein Lal_00000162 [Lupinus albus]|uniref:Uncharacterized protein n=1 Tax=Lupinus albus TaxID=3870 RepID=A0A6A5LJ14_LUPAL|nr:hypothetical protein Lalb_Chr21g0305271 [Lupinus albus]KAF1860749.1 hypothetical protein Lal_00000162 [Lupinus albus]
MGNCFLGVMADHEKTAIKVITSNGGIMEFKAPITVSFITNEFPGHAIFRTHDLFWKPLNQFHDLVPGQSYYLLPLNNKNNIVRQGHIRSHSVPTITSYPAPYRMFLSSIEPFCSSRNNIANSNVYKCSRGGSIMFWKVKLVITPQELEDILAQEARTKELIESMRIVAKCGISSAASDILCDQWSFSNTSVTVSSKIDALVAGI